MNNDIVIEQEYKASLSDVWCAISNREEMKKWYFDTLVSFVPEEGFKTQFSVFSNGGNYIHVWEITQVNYRRKIAYTWRYDGYPGISKVIFELFPQANSVLLRLTHEGIDSFPQDNPVFARENFVAGWKSLLQTKLKKYLTEKTKLKEVQEYRFHTFYY
jgi:uncharacterized protein YndB with AHSA1/START domain